MSCVLFNEKDSNRGIFVKRAFQDVGKPEKIREHAEAKYHNENLTLANNFVMSFEDPKKNLDYDPKKQERYDKKSPYTETYHNGLLHFVLNKA